MKPSDWDKHYETGAGYRSWPNDELVRFLSGQRPGHWLEVGCGGGGNLRGMIEKATSITGIDLHNGALGHARDMLSRSDSPAPVTLSTGNAFEVPFHDGSFDGVVDCMVSQHVPWARHIEFYAEMARVLKPGGWLWVYHLDDMTQPSFRESLGGYDVSMLSLFPAVPFFCLPEREALRSAVKYAGFETTVRGLKREYPDGQVASYTIVEAVKS